MKTVSALLLIIFLCCWQNDLSTKEIAEKVSKIRMELLNNKSLVSNFLKPNGVSVIFTDSMMHFMYNTTRKENNLIDSVLINGSTSMDSLEDLTFHEMHLKNGKEDKSYIYTVNKYGVIDWAYRTDPPTSEPTMVEKDDKVRVTPSNQLIMEINTDSSIYNYDPIHYPIKKPDEKTMAIYIARLKASLDELDKMLFAK